MASHADRATHAGFTEQVCAELRCKKECPQEKEEKASIARINQIDNIMLKISMEPRPNLKRKRPY